MTGIRDKAADSEKRTEKKRHRDLFLFLPSRIILNERGVSFFMSHGHTLHRFETADGERHFGFRFERTGFAWLKKLLLKNYLKKIEIQVKDISACRVHVEDAVKMVFFSMFRHRINSSVIESVYDSPMLRAWNRANPKKSIGPGVKIAEESFRELLNSRMPGKMEDLKSELFHKIIETLPPSFIETREDPRDLHNFVRELIADLNALILFVLAGSRGEDRARLIQNICKVIIEFIHRFDILNLASFLAIELVSAAERSSLVRMLEISDDIKSILESPDRRKSIMSQKRFRGATVVLAVPPDIPPENRRLRFRLSVYNDGADAQAERKLMEDFTERSYTFKDGRHLEEFFKRSGREPGVYEDNGMCFYYLTILQEQCRKNNILLDATVKSSHSGESVVTTLWFGF
ncbi:MAG: hypothetical protein LBQ57_00655 [Spirochaetales bacterium]|nr:hypothetical protein [Spirochaetales bacterium]